jgi:hypothetical protein
VAKAVLVWATPLHHLALEGGGWFPWPSTPRTAMSVVCYSSCVSQRQPLSFFSQKFSGTAELCRACNLTAFTHSPTNPVGQPYASCHEGPGFNPQGGTYVKPGFSYQHCPAAEWCYLAFEGNFW